MRMQITTYTQGLPSLLHSFHSIKMPRILVLHGFTQNDYVAQKNFSAIHNVVKGHLPNVEFVYGCGPIAVPEPVAREMFEKFGMSITEGLLKNNRCWWRVSDDGKDYNGWETSLAYLEDLEQV